MIKLERKQYNEQGEAIQDSVGMVSWEEATEFVLDMFNTHPDAAMFEEILYAKRKKSDPPLEEVESLNGLKNPDGKWNYSLMHGGRTVSIKDRTGKIIFQLKQK